MGTPTVSILATDNRPSGYQGRKISFTFSSSYADGGEAITTTTTNLGAITAVVAGGSDGGYAPEWDASGGLMKAIWMATGAEATAGHDLSSVVFYCDVTGTAPTGG